MSAMTPRPTSGDAVTLEEAVDLQRDGDALVGHVHEGWDVFGVPHGGYLLALAGNAVLTATGAPDVFTITTIAAATTGRINRYGTAPEPTRRSDNGRRRRAPIAGCSAATAAACGAELRLNVIRAPRHLHALRTDVMLSLAACAA